MRWIICTAIAGLVGLAPAARADDDDDDHRDAIRRLQKQQEKYLREQQRRLGRQPQFRYSPPGPMPFDPWRREAYRVPAPQFWYYSWPAPCRYSDFGRPSTPGDPYPAPGYAPLYQYHGLPTAPFGGYRSGAFAPYFLPGPGWRWSGDDDDDDD
jgi:hypothetical protein